jgi:hypothetical protein
MAILPLGHTPTQPQSPGEFVAGLSTSQVEVHRKLSLLHRLSREAGCVDATGPKHNKFDVNWALALASVGSMDLSSARLARGGSGVRW